MISSGITSYATHLVGGYMSYRYVGPLPNGMIRYFVTLNLYRDCLQSEVPLDNEISIGVYFNNTNKDLYNVAKIRLLTRKNVEPPGNIDCDYYKRKVCIEEGFYQGFIDVAPSSVGYLLTYVRCCRNIQDNLPNDGGQPFMGQTYYCQIPPTSIINSSPAFSGIPSPYMCANDTTNILNSAVDPDGDELIYSIALPYQGGDNSMMGAEPPPPNRLKLPIDPVVYNPGYSYTSPFGANGMALVNPSNGLTSLFAPKTGSYVIAVEVQEWRQGKLLSVVRLDLQILVLDCPPNNAPRISNSTTSFEAEIGSKICFNISASDKDMDVVSLAGKGDIFTGANGYTGPKATLTKTSGAGSTTSEFCWQTDCNLSTQKTYIFTAEVWDDGCPPKFDNKNFSITLKPFQGADGISGPDPVCNYSKNNLYTALNTKAGSKFQWIVNGGEIKGSDSGSTVLIDWLTEGTGSITVTEISRFGCPGKPFTRNITILKSPDLPVITGKDTVCEGTMNEPYSVGSTPNSTYQWSVLNGALTPNGNTASVNWPVKGQGRIWALERSQNGCLSDTAYKNVNIRKPQPFVEGTYSVCPNAQGIEYQVNSDWGSTYLWNIVGGTLSSGQGTSKVKVNWGNQGLGEIQVTETDRFGCKSELIRTQVDKNYILQGSFPSGPDEVCEFDADVSYTAKRVQNSVYYWQISGGTQASGDSSPNIQVNWGATGNGYVSVQERSFDQVNQRACSSAYNRLDVIIHPLPVATIIQGDTDICEGPDTLLYTLAGFPRSTYTWKLDGVVLPENGPTLKMVWNTPGIYQLSVKELTENNCPGIEIDTVVSVRPKPATQGIFGDQVVCVPDITGRSYSVKGFANSHYLWQVNQGNIIQGSGTDSVIVDWQNIRYAGISFVEVSEYGCYGDTLRLPVYVHDLQVYLDVISVGYPDDRMYTEWKQGIDSANDQPFVIEKRKAGTGDFWNVAGITESTIHNFLDKPLNTDDFPYNYRIKGTDMCGNVRISEVHTNIWLSGQKAEDEESISLIFSPYLGWQNGVDFYEIYRKSNRDEDFSLVQIAMPNSTISFPISVRSFKDCFRIKGYELTGNQKVTWSNEICFNYLPNVFVPNAFTPNADQMNDGFRAIPVSVDKYEMHIFNRWGEKLWSTSKLDESWNGEYLGQKAQAGVYMYRLKFTDFENREYYKSGTFHLLR